MCESIEVQVAQRSAMLTLQCAEDGLIDVGSLLDQLSLPGSSSGESLNGDYNDDKCTNKQYEVKTKEHYDCPCGLDDLRNDGNATMESQRSRKRVKIVVDMDEDKESRVLYELSEDAVVSVPYNMVTWDNMVSSIRIALQMNSPFVCDSFLGSKTSLGLFHELLALKNTGYFDLHMRGTDKYHYASTCLSKAEPQHKFVDSLVLIFFKLASYYSKAWKGVSVEILYFPNGMKTRQYRNNSLQRTLSALYFCTAVPQVREEEGCLTVYTDYQSTAHKFSHHFDRLVAFWRPKKTAAILSHVSSQIFLIQMSLIL